MALQELSPLPRVTGLDQLGGVIANAGERYANTARQDQLIAQQRAQQLADMDRARANQLSDVQSNRAYADQRFYTERLARMSDEQKRAIFQLREAMKQDAINAGLITEDEAGRGDVPGNPAKIEAAVKELARRGLLDKYKTLLQSGALKVADVTNPLAVDTAMQTEGDRTAKLVAAEREQAGLQQRDFTRLRQEEQQIQGQIKALSDELQKTADYVPSNAEVANAALVLAQSLKKPGEVPSQNEIQSQRSAAIQSLRENGMQNQALDKQTKAVQLNALYQQLQAIKANTQEYIRKGIGPSVMAEAAPASTVLAPSSVPVSSASPMQSFQQMLAERIAPTKSAPAETPATATQAASNLAPVTSAQGLLQRAPTGEQLIQAPGRAINDIGRYGGALVQGLWNGDYRVPQQGLVDRASDSLARVLRQGNPIGRPVLSAQSLFPTPPNWWSADHK